MITVVLPVGPFKDDAKYLKECLVSIREQTLKPEQVIVVSDCSGVLLAHEINPVLNPDHDPYNSVDVPIPNTSIWNHWRLGCAASWNQGVGASSTECCFLMGADDTLEPNALEECWKAYLAHRDPLGYYYLPVRYDSGEMQDLPCNAAMVTKTLWHHIGGFPPEAGVGAPDALLISIIMGQKGRAGNLYRVGGAGHLYNVRSHPGQDTRRQGKYHTPMMQIRDIATATWNHPEWGGLHIGVRGRVGFDV